VANRWLRQTSTSGAPSARWSHTAVQVGGQMIVWGGTGDDVLLNDGGRYDVAADTWSATALDAAPTPRGLHTAISTGSTMVVWGGFGERIDNTLGSLDTGGRYDPIANSWAPTSTVAAPEPRE